MVEQVSTLLDCQDHSMTFNFLRQVPGLTSCSKKRNKAVREPDSEDSDEDMIQEVFDQWDEQVRQLISFGARVSSYKT